MDGDLYFLYYKLWSVFVKLMLQYVAWSYCLTSNITGIHGCTPADMLFAHTIKRVLENTTKLYFVCTLLDEQCTLLDDDCTLPVCLYFLKRTVAVHCTVGYLALLKGYSCQ